MPTEVPDSCTMSEYAASWSQTSTLASLLVQLPPSSNEERTRSFSRRSHVDGAVNRMRSYLPPVSVALIRTVEPCTVGVIRLVSKANFWLNVAPASELIAYARLWVPCTTHLSSLLASLRAAA